MTSESIICIRVRDLSSIDSLLKFLDSPRLDQAEARGLGTHCGFPTCMADTKAQKLSISPQGVYLQEAEAKVEFTQALQHGLGS